VPVRAGDAAELAAAVRGLRDSPAEREALAAAARRFAAGTLRHAQVERLEALLSGAIR
jgi:hypothetical protein